MTISAMEKNKAGSGRQIPNGVALLLFYKMRAGWLHWKGNIWVEEGKSQPVETCAGAF